MAQKVKLSTIAESLGLSTATISLALRDSPLVAVDTREKIKEQARFLGYIYNRRAASLRTSRSGIIGVVVHDIMNPFYGEILKAIETVLHLRRSAPAKMKSMIPEHVWALVKRYGVEPLPGERSRLPTDIDALP